MLHGTLCIMTSYACMRQVSYFLFIYLQWLDQTFVPRCVFLRFPLHSVDSNPSLSFGMRNTMMMPYSQHCIHRKWYAFFLLRHPLLFFLWSSSMCISICRNLRRRNCRHKFQQIYAWWCNSAYHPVFWVHQSSQCWWCPQEICSFRQSIVLAVVWHVLLLHFAIPRPIVWLLQGQQSRHWKRRRRRRRRHPQGWCNFHKSL